MKEELELKLVAKYPDICSNYGGDQMVTCFHWGFECGDGWYELIDSCLEQIDYIAKKNNISVKIDQIKSKLGRLVIYLDFEKGPTGKHVSAAIDAIHNIVDQVWKNSQNISEISGLPASPKIINNWIFTVTDSEAQEIIEKNIDK
jgi:hypothetical protein